MMTAVIMAFLYEHPNFLNDSFSIKSAGLKKSFNLPFHKLNEINTKNITFFALYSKVISIL